MSRSLKSRRALRRHHAKRKLNNALRKFEDWKMRDEPEMQAWIRRNANHLAACSCWMCGHARQWEGLTMQEKRSLMALSDEN